jgi:hypothetical protein
MAPSTSPFRFDDQGLPPSPALVANVPAGIGTKEGLLDELAQRLHFPECFGANWDALWECIRDLSWLPAGPVVLRHADLPLAEDVAGLKTYLSILTDTVQKKWSGSRERDLVVVFPPETREQVAWLLRLAARDEEAHQDAGHRVRDQAPSPARPQGTGPRKDARILYRGVPVVPDWPERIRLAQEIRTCRPNGVEVPRVAYGSEREDWGADDHPCHDCAVVKGEFHVPGCDAERCPACGGQMWFGCECQWPDDEERS